MKKSNQISKYSDFNSKTTEQIIMRRFIFIVILIILFFIQIITIDAKLAKRRFKNHDELIRIICGKNGIYCKRGFQ